MFCGHKISFTPRPPSYIYTCKGTTIMTTLKGITFLTLTWSGAGAQLIYQILPSCSCRWEGQLQKYTFVPSALCCRSSDKLKARSCVESIAVCLEPVEGNCSSSAGYFTLLCCCQWRDCAAPTLSLCPWPSARILCFKGILVIIASSSPPWTQSKSWWDFSPFLQQHQHCWYIYIMNQINPKYSSSDWSWLDKASSRIHSDTIFVKFNQTANTGTAMLYSPGW